MLVIAVIAALFVALLLWSLCVAAGRADDATELLMRKIRESERDG